MTAGVPREESLPLSAEMRIDAVCVRFEAAWKAVESGGTRPAIEACLGDAPESERQALLRELLALELHYRKQQGERPTADEYRPRFREHSVLIGRLFAEQTQAEPPPAPEARAPGRPSGLPQQESAGQRADAGEFQDRVLRLLDLAA